MLSAKAGVVLADEVRGKLASGNDKCSLSSVLEFVKFLNKSSKNESLGNLLLPILLLFLSSACCFFHLSNDGLLVGMY